MQIQPTTNAFPRACIIFCDDVVRHTNGRVDLIGMDWPTYVSDFPRKAGFWVYVRLHVPYSLLGQEHRVRVALRHEDLGDIYASDEETVELPKGDPGAAQTPSFYIDTREADLERAGRYSVVVTWDGHLLVEYEVPFKKRT
jgi:hypothetical protein